MKFCMIVLFLISMSQSTLAEPVVSDSDKMSFLFGSSSTSSNSWCSWFRFFKLIDESWSLSLPEGWDRNSPIVLCDRVRVESTPVEFMSFLRDRYPGCLNITVNAHPAEKSIEISLGPNVIKGYRETVSETFLVKGEESVSVESVTDPVRMAHICVHDINNGPEEKTGFGKVVEAALSDQ